MTGFGILLRHELRGMKRTWRGPVILAVTLCLALSGPALTLFMPDILASVGGLELVGPDPTWRDAAAQWSSDLSQVLAILALLVLAHSVAHPITSGTAGLLLARPIKRPAVLIAPAAAALLTAAVAVLLGALASGLMTALIFDGAPLSFPLGMTLRWIVLMTVLGAATVFGAGVTGGMGGAAGFSVGLYLLLALISTVPLAADYSPAGLFDLAGGENWVWAALTGVLLGGALIITGARRFSSLSLSSSPRS